MTGFDLTRRPVGQRAWADFVDWVLSGDGPGESEWLEFKSDLDLPSSKGWEVVARFILGSANRLPEHATHLGGAAVLLVGVDDAGGFAGVKPVDPADSQQGLDKYLGEDGPRWDQHWVAMEANGSGVMVFEVDAPEPGRVHLCKASGQKNRSGAVYVRSKGKTEEADYAQMRERLERLRRGIRKAEIAVELAGRGYRLPDLDAVNAEYVRQQAAQFRSRHAPDHETPWGVTDMMALIGGLTPQKAAAHIAEWERDRMRDWPDRRGLLIGAFGDGVEVRIGLDPGSAPLLRPQVVLTFRNAQGFCWEDPTEQLYDAIFPEPSDPSLPGAAFLGLQPFPPEPISRRDVEWENTDDKTLVLTVKPDAIRPGQPWASGISELVVAASDPTSTAVQVDWTASFADVPGAVTGHLSLPLTDLPGVPQPPRS